MKQFKWLKTKRKDNPQYEGVCYVVTEEYFHVLKIKETSIIQQQKILILEHFIGKRL